MGRLMKKSFVIGKRNIKFLIDCKPEKKVVIYFN